MELEGYPELETEEIFIDAKLRLNHQDLSEPELPGLPIEAVTFRVNDIENGIFSYVEANFKSPYLSELNFTVFSFISSFKFTKYQPVKKEL